MGSGASSAAVGATSQDDLKSVLETMSPEERARLTNLLQEVEQTAESGTDCKAEEIAKAPTFEKAPMVVPGISKEEALPKRGLVSIAPPAGRPRSAEMTKRAIPATGNECKDDQVLKEEPKAEQAKEQIAPQDMEQDTSRADAEAKGLPIDEAKANADNVETVMQDTSVEAPSADAKGKSLPTQGAKVVTGEAHQTPIAAKEETVNDEAKTQMPKTDVDADKDPSKLVKTVASTEDSENTASSKLEQKREEPTIAEHTEIVSEK